MKQPEQKVILTDDGTNLHVCMIAGAGCVDISYAKTERSAMKAAIKRLYRLAKDAEHLLENLK